MTKKATTGVTDRSAALQSAGIDPAKAAGLDWKQLASVVLALLEAFLAKGPAPMAAQAGCTDLHTCLDCAAHCQAHALTATLQALECCPPGPAPSP